MPITRPRLRRRRRWRQPRAATSRCGGDDRTCGAALFSPQTCAWSRLRRMLSRPLQVEIADEVAGLDEEADLPLEQLLARYGNYHLAAGGAGTGEESAGACACSGRGKQLCGCRICPVSASRLCIVHVMCGRLSICRCVATVQALVTRGRPLMLSLTSRARRARQCCWRAMQRCMCQQRARALPSCSRKSCRQRRRQQQMWRGTASPPPRRRCRATRTTRVRARLPGMCGRLCLLCPHVPVLRKPAAAAHLGLCASPDPFTASPPTALLCLHRRR